MNNTFFGTKFTWYDIIGIMSVWLVACYFLTACTTERDCVREASAYSKTRQCHDNPCRAAWAEMEMAYYFNCEKNER